MAKNYYLPTDDSGKADLLDHFAAKLPQYAGLLEISDADVAATQADAANFRYDLQAHSNAAKPMPSNGRTTKISCVTAGRIISTRPPRCSCRPPPSPSPPA